ncbi:MAG TPA: sulfur transferase domain-containing protein [Acidobacteriota bacterium]|jgi:uncharacterized protein (TIGR01244 family)
MKNLALFITLIGTFVFVFGYSVDQIPNLQQPQVFVYTSGQPSAEGFQKLSEMGIKTVINVLPENQCVPNEFEMVTANHMTYRSVPFHLSGFKKQTIEHFAEVLKKAEKPVLIHCATGNHVGGLWFAYRLLEQNIPLEQALSEARKIGMRPELENDLYLWIADQYPKAIAQTEF